jgi:uncharacterized SAM-binding protein YcdF (DUF218 family)
VPTGSRSRRSMVKRYAPWVLVAILCDLVLALAFWFAAPLLLTQFDEGPLTAPAVVVFYTDTEDEIAARLNVAGQLAQRFPGSPLLLVGGSRPAQRYYGSDEMAARLSALGVEASRLRTERFSYDTKTNLEAARGLAAQAERAELLLVTDRLHLLRIYSSFRKRNDSQRLSHVRADPSDLMTAVWRSHYELVAWTALVLPECFRLTALRALRS